MNNASLFTADRSTHLKIVVLSLIASVVVMLTALSAHVASDSGNLQASAPVKAGKVTTFTSRVTTIR
jgi:hypothetical protein